MKGIVGSVLAAGLVLGAGAAGAKPTGVVAHSGKDKGVYCTECHQKGTGSLPTVALSGPTDVGGGDKNRYTFTVTPTSAKHSAVGLDVAADGGTLAVVTKGTQ